MTRGTKRLALVLMTSAAPALVGLLGAGVALGLPGMALAADECGSAVTQSVTCAPGTYASGITYAPASPLSVTLQQAPGGAVNVTNGGLRVTTTVADAITVGRTATGTLTTASPALAILNTTVGGTAVNLTGAQGAVTLDLTAPAANASLLVRGQTDAIRITTGGSASVALNQGQVIGLNGDAIDIRAGGAITVTTGQASLQATNGAGITLVQNGPSGAINVTTGGPITAPTYIIGDGILIGAQDPTNIDAINVSANGAITVGGSGIRINSSGSRNLTISTSATAAIQAQNDGIFARTSGSGAINLTTAADVTGDANSGGVGNAVSLITANGNINFSAAAGTTIYEGVGSPPVGLPSKSVVSLTSTNGSIVFNNAAALRNSNVTSGEALATGIFARTVGGSITLNNSGAMGTADSVLGASAIDAAITGTASTGDLIVSNSGVLRALGPAVINLENAGSGILRLDSNSAIEGTALFGVQTFAATGTSTLNFGANVSSAISTAVRAGSSTGAVNVNVASGVQVRGIGGFLLSSTSGALSLNNAGSVQTTTGGTSAVVLSTTGAASVTNSGTINALGPEIGRAALSFVNASQVSLTNTGTITTGRDDHAGYAIGVFTLGSPNPTAITWSNATGGVINGALNNATPTAMTFGNAGTWYTANMQSNFSSANVSTLNNSGLIQVGLTNALPAATTTTFAGLTRFNNNGTVSLSNGVVGDVLSVTGAYVGGTGAQVNLDIQSGVSDRLVIAGTATGATTVVINQLGAPGSFGKIAIAQAATGSSATAFVLPNGTLRQGLTQSGIIYDATSSIYSLIRIPDTAAVETVKFAEIRRNLYFKAEAAWSSHLERYRTLAMEEDVPEGVHTWAQVFGGEERHDDSRTLAPLGVQTTYRLDYDQRYAGGQFGVDVLQGMSTGAAVLGVTAGYATSRATFKETRDTYEVKGFNIGAYASYTPNAFFMNALVRYDRGDGDIESPYANYRQSLKTSQFAATLEAGKHMTMGGWFVEPSAAVTASRGSVARKGDEEALNNYNVQDVTVALSRDTLVRAKVGVRAGAKPHAAMGGILTPYVAVAAVNDFGGKDKVTFNPASNPISFANRAAGAFADVRVGAHLAQAGGMEFLAEAGGDFGSHVSGYGLRVMVKRSW